MGHNANQFNMPNGVALDVNNNVYVTDRLNFRVQKFNALASGILKINQKAGAPEIFPNPTKGRIEISGVYGKDVKLELYDIRGNLVSNDKMHVGETNEQMDLSLLEMACIFY